LRHYNTGFLTATKPLFVEEEEEEMTEVETTEAGAYTRPLPSST
jgi:hypothetical protein